MENSNTLWRLVKGQQTVLFYTVLFETVTVSRISLGHPAIQIPRLNAGQDTVPSFHPYLSKQRYGDSRVPGSSKYKTECFTSQNSCCAGLSGTVLCLKALHGPPTLRGEGSDSQCDSQGPALHLGPHLQPPLPLTYLNQPVSPPFPKHSTPGFLPRCSLKPPPRPSAKEAPLIMRRPARIHQAEFFQLLLECSYVNQLYMYMYPLFVRCYSPTGHYRELSSVPVQHSRL